MTSHIMSRHIISRHMRSARYIQWYMTSFSPSAGLQRFLGSRTLGMQTDCTQQLRSSVSSCPDLYRSKFSGWIRCTAMIDLRCEAGFVHSVGSHRMSISTYAGVLACTYAWMHVCTHVCMCLCACVCVCVDVCISVCYTYIHTYMHTYITKYILCLHTERLAQTLRRLGRWTYILVHTSTY